MAETTPSPARPRARDVAQQLLDRTPLRPRVAMLLGTGHASIANQLKDKVAFHADELGDHTLASPLLIGLLEGVPVAVADAPLATFESSRKHDVNWSVRVLRALGAEVLILTAGAASLSRQLDAGSLAVLEDHINLSGLQPLTGSDDGSGPIFPDMSEPYQRELIELARETALRGGIPCLPGVFAGIPGPSLPTRAEYRFLRHAGADLVGMSLIPEVIAAVHAGFQVLALVGITQQIADDSRSPASIEAMLDAADLAAPRMASLLVGIVGSLP